MSNVSRFGLDDMKRPVRRSEKQVRMTLPEWNARKRKQEVEAMKRDKDKIPPRWFHGAELEREAFDPSRCAVCGGRGTIQIPKNPRTGSLIIKACPHLSKEGVRHAS